MNCDSLIQDNDVIDKASALVPGSYFPVEFNAIFHKGSLKGQQYIASGCHISLIEFRKPFTQSKCINCIGLQNNNILKKLFHAFIQTVILNLVMLN